MKLETFIAQNAYLAYSYSYPHKNSYREFSSAIPLSQVWKNEDKAALFLYLHIPFCEMRCGFCNLFTIANPKTDLQEQYTQALLKQIRLAGDAMADSGFARLAVGGGTPSFLSAVQLEKIFAETEKHLDINIHSIPSSCEVSPYTASKEKLKLLLEVGIDRISIGIQSFSASENKIIGRYQPDTQVRQALDAIRGLAFNTLNLDFIYGIPGQTAETWLQTLVDAMAYEPEEIYLYPLYVRPQTGIGKKGYFELLENRLQLYRIGRQFLIENGYRQISMRMFQQASRPQDQGPVYCCQEDGLLGLGAGARSYTQSLHYSSHYAVEKKSTIEVTKHYIDEQNCGHINVNYGIQLNDDEKRRRYIILSILTLEGLSLSQYYQRFNSQLLEDFPKLTELTESGFAVTHKEIIQLTEKGVENSDSIGPWLYSQQVNNLVHRCQIK